MPVMATACRPKPVIAWKCYDKTIVTAGTSWITIKVGSSQLRISGNKQIAELALACRDCLVAMESSGTYAGTLTRIESLGLEITTLSDRALLSLDPGEHRFGLDRFTLHDLTAWLMFQQDQASTLAADDLSKLAVKPTINGWQLVYSFDGDICKTQLSAEQADAFKEAIYGLTANPEPAGHKPKISQPGKWEFFIEEVSNGYWLYRYACRRRSGAEYVVSKYGCFLRRSSLLRLALLLEGDS